MMSAVKPGYAHWLVAAKSEDVSLFTAYPLKQQMARIHVKDQLQPEPWTRVDSRSVCCKVCNSNNWIVTVCSPTLEGY